MISRIITIDQSTSATKAMLFSEDCELLHRVNIEHQQFYPQIGWVEHDAEEIYKNTIEAIHCLLEQEEVNGKDISYSLAITNQRETVVVWNRHTGKSVYHAVVWQCQRGAAICKELKDKGYSELVQNERPDCLSILIFLPVVLSGYWITWKMHVNWQKKAIC